METAITGDFIGARNKMLEVMHRYGLSGVDIVKQFQTEVWKLNILDRSKVSIVDKIGDIEFRMVEGSDEFIQLEALLAHLTLFGEKK